MTLLLKIINYNRGTLFDTSFLVLSIILVCLILRFLSSMMSNSKVCIDKKDCIYLISSFFGYALFIVLIYIIKVEILKSYRSFSNYLIPIVNIIFHIGLLLGILSQLDTIGDNIKKKTGRKPFIFRYIENIFKILKPLLNKKIKSIFNSK